MKTDLFVSKVIKHSRNVYDVLVMLVIKQSRNVYDVLAMLVIHAQWLYTLRYNIKGSVAT